MFHNRVIIHDFMCLCATTVVDGARNAGMEMCDARLCIFGAGIVCVILGRLARRGLHHRIPRVTVVARLTRQGHLWDSEPEHDLLCTSREPASRRPSE